MATGVEAISIIADHAAVGAVFGAAGALASGRRDQLDLWLASGMITGASYGFLIAVWGVS